MEFFRSLLEAIELSDTRALYQPSFATYQHPDAQISKPGPGMSQIANAHPQRGLIRRSASSIPGGATELGQPTGPQATDLKRLLKPGGEFSAAGGP